MLFRRRQFEWTVGTSSSRAPLLRKFQVFLTSLNREDSRDVIRNHFASPTVSEQITLGEVFHRMGTYFPQFGSLGDPRSSDRQIWDLVRAPCLL